jgi:hypothetical protein
MTQEAAAGDETCGKNHFAAASMNAISHASGARARSDHEGIVAVLGDLPPEIFVVPEILE